MINIEFKEPCNKCKHVDVDYEEMAFYVSTGPYDKNVRIYCRHQEVCKEYRESKDYMVDTIAIRV